MVVHENKIVATANAFLAILTEDGSQPAEAIAVGMTIMALSLYRMSAPEPIKRKLIESIPDHLHAFLDGMPKIENDSTPRQH